MSGTMMPHEANAPQSCTILSSSLTDIAAQHGAGSAGAEPDGLRGQAERHSGLAVHPMWVIDLVAGPGGMWAARHWAPEISTGQRAL